MERSQTAAIMLSTFSTGLSLKIKKKECLRILRTRKLKPRRTQRLTRDLKK